MFPMFVAIIAAIQVEVKEQAHEPNRKNFRTYTRSNVPKQYPQHLAPTNSGPQILRLFRDAVPKATLQRPV